MLIPQFFLMALQVRISYESRRWHNVASLNVGKSCHVAGRALQKQGGMRDCENTIHSYLLPSKVGDPAVKALKDSAKVSLVVGRVARRYSTEHGEQTWRCAFKAIHSTSIGDLCTHASPSLAFGLAPLHTAFSSARYSCGDLSDWLALST